jgi:hypothetical protein
MEGGEGGGGGAGVRIFHKTNNDTGIWCSTFDGGRRRNVEASQLWIPFLQAKVSTKVSIN